MRHVMGATPAVMMVHEKYRLCCGVCLQMNQNAMLHVPCFICHTLRLGHTSCGYPTEDAQPDS